MGNDCSEIFGRYRILSQGKRAANASMQLVCTIEDYGGTRGDGTIPDRNKLQKPEGVEGGPCGKQTL